MKNYKSLIKFLTLIVVIQALILFWFILPKKKHEVAPTRPAVKRYIKTAPKKPVVSIKGKIAIVLDDWGYEPKNEVFLSEIKEPFTLAVLPNLTYSREVSLKAKNSGKEVILHLPLIPHPSPNYRLEADTIDITMPKYKIKAILDKALSSVPGAKGVSNHMGSLATENENTMRIIFSELKKRRLYFLDSFVTPKSICKKIALDLGIGFAARSVFLDNKPEQENIKKQLRQLVSEAQKNGFAVGIGHDKHVTLVVLKELMPAIEEEGFEFVLLSDIVR